MSDIEEDKAVFGLCPYCSNNDTDYGYQYQWDYCDKAKDLTIDQNANGICIECGGFEEVDQC